MEHFGRFYGLVFSSTAVVMKMELREKNGHINKSKINFSKKVFNRLFMLNNNYFVCSTLQPLTG